MVTSEKLTCLLFLKMADERSRPPYSQPSLIRGVRLALAARARRR